MRILHVITTLQTGGAEKLIVDLLPRLRDAGHQVELVVFNGLPTHFYKELEKYGIIIHSFGEGGVYKISHIYKLIPYLRKFDIIHTHNTSPQIFAAIASVFRKSHLVYTEHSTDNRRRHYRWLKPFDKWCYKRYEKIICISDKAEENLRSYLNDNYTDRICTINNGIDVRKFADANPDAELMSMKSNKFSVAMIAGLRPEKDQDTLIRAMALLPDDYLLWLVGDGARRNILEKLCIELNVRDKVFFLGQRSDVPNVLHAADVLVLSSHYEGLSLSSLECMASGKPFIASDVDGLSQVVEGYGILFPHQDEYALAAELIKFRNNPAYYTSVTERCKIRASEFDIAKMVDEYLKVYLDIYDSKKSKNN